MIVSLQQGWRQCCSSWFLFIVVGFGEASDAILILRAAPQCSALVWILLVLLQGHNYSVSSFSRSRMSLGPGGILRLSMTNCWDERDQAFWEG